MAIHTLFRFCSLQNMFICIVKNLPDIKHIADTINICSHISKKMQYYFLIFYDYIKKLVLIVKKYKRYK